MKKNKLTLLILSISTLLGVGVLTYEINEVVPTYSLECSHEHVNHYAAKEATCSKPGHIEYWICCDCRMSYSDKDCTQLIENTGYGLSSPQDGRYVAPHTSNGQYKVQKEPTTTEQGVAINTCKKCNESVYKPILKLPNVTLSDTTLSWQGVSGAATYNVIIDGYVVRTSPATTYTINPEDINKDIRIEANPISNTYYKYGSSQVSLSSNLDNLQQYKNYDFENRIYTLPAFSNKWEGRYGNFNGADWFVYSEDNGNTTGMLRVDSHAGDMKGSLRKDLSSGVSGVGKYTMTYRIKLSSVCEQYKYIRTLFANIDYQRTSDGTVGFVAGSAVNLNTLSSSNWTTVSMTFDKVEQSNWQQLVFFYYSNGNEVISADDYILIDDITFHLNGDPTDCDTYEGGFEYFEPLFTGTNKAAGWHFNNSVYLSDANYGSGIVIEEDYNRAIKVYSESEYSVIDLSGNTEILNAGLYQLTFDIKLGSECTLINNLGFTGYSGGGNSFENLYIPLPSGVNPRYYTNVTYNFYTTGLGQDWLNLNFFAKTNNFDKNPNNYFLMDNVMIKKINTVKSTLGATSIKSLSEVAWVTGKDAVTNTLSNYNIGSTDLGIPFYDYENEKMYIAFGDTYSGYGEEVRQGNWRCNVIGVTTDLDASDGVSFDTFLNRDYLGRAQEIIGAKHEDNVEVTNIPTGGIIVNGTMYLFHMSIKHWGDAGEWDINYSGVYKSTNQGLTWSKVNDLIWTDPNPSGYTKTLTSSEWDRRLSSNFLQIFPIDGNDGYIYLYGLTGGRFGGVKLMRVLKANIEIYNEYEYFLGLDVNGNPIFEKGDEARRKLHNSNVGYIIHPDEGVAEISVMFNKYLNKWMLCTQFQNRDIYYMLSDTPYGVFKDKTLVARISDYGGLYGAFMHEKYTEQDGKVMYFFMSRWGPYNVQVMRLELN